MLEQDTADTNAFRIERTPSFFVNGRPLAQFGPTQLTELVQRALSVQGGAMQAFDEARREFEREYLTRVLKLTSGNVSQAARIAQRNRTDFYALLGRHQIDPASFKD